MKKLIVSLAIASSALIATAPAAAQRYGYPDGNIYQRLERIEFRIDRGAQRGALTRGEAQRLRYEAGNIKRLAYRYGRDGVQAWEHRDLARRVDRLQNRLQRERFDDDRRGWRG
jgi:hypothetical protein